MFAGLKPGFGFSFSYVIICFIFNELRWEVVVYFIDICTGSLNSLFVSLKSYPSQDVGRMAVDVNSELYRASPVTGNAEYCASNTLTMATKS